VLEGISKLKNGTNHFSILAVNLPLKAIPAYETTFETTCKTSCAVHPWTYDYLITLQARTSVPDQFKNDDIWTRHMGLRTV